MTHYTEDRFIKNAVRLINKCKLTDDFISSLVPTATGLISAVRSLKNGVDTNQKEYFEELAEALERLSFSGRLMLAPSVTATAAASGGSFTAGTYFYRVTAVDKDGQESLPSREVSVAVAANGKVNITISNVGATSYKIYRGNGSFSQNSVLGTTNTNFEDTGSAATPATPPTVGKAMTRLLTDDMVSAAKTAASVQALLSSIANQANTFIDTTLDDGETIPQ